MRQRAEDRAEADALLIEEQKRYPARDTSTMARRPHRGRILEQRIAIRYPALGRYMLAVLMRLPTDSRLRQSLLLRNYRAAYAAVGRSDLEALTVNFAPEFELLTAAADRLESPFFADFEEVYRGPDGYRRFFEAWMDAGWEEFRIECDDVRALGDDRVLAFTHYSGRGRSSGFELDQDGADLHRFRGGMVVEYRIFLDRARALAAAGLAE
jgi:ketosteroid isomerase-like protein